MYNDWSDPAEKVKVGTDTLTQDSWKFLEITFIAPDLFALDSLGKKSGSHLYLTCKLHLV